MFFKKYQSLHFYKPMTFLQKLYLDSETFIILLKYKIQYEEHFMGYFLLLVSVSLMQIKNICKILDTPQNSWNVLINKDVCNGKYRVFF